MKRFLVFLALSCGFAGLWWLAGYNFDERNPLVALCAAWSLVCCGILTMAVCGD